VRVADGRQEGRLSRVREAHKPNVGNQLEGQVECDIVPWGTVGMFARGLMSGGFPVTISQAAFSAFGGEVLLAVDHNICQEDAGFPVPYLGPARNLDDQVGAVPAVEFLSLPVAASLGPLVGGKMEMNQGLNIVVRAKDDVSPASAVTPIRTALRDEFFPAEAYTSIAAIARGCKHGDGVDELPGFHDETTRPT
jgi:hypothetical protein